MEARLCETPVTGTHLAKTLQETFGPHAILQSVEVEKLAPGQGYISHLLRVKLTWESDDHLPKTVIVKVTSSETLSKTVEDTNMVVTEDQKKEQTKRRALRMFHESECELYQLIGNEEPMPVPKCYAISLGGPEVPSFIVLEDLSEKASVIPCLVLGMSLAQILEAVTALAKLHGWSLITKTDWRNRVQGYEKREDLLKPFVDLLRPAYQSVKKIYPDLFGSMDVDKVVDFVSLESMKKIGLMHNEYMQDVLVHGDFWANNIMYEKHSDGSMSDRLIAVIDFQHVMKGSPMADLARLMTWSVTHQIRRDHIQQILNHYYQTVKSIAGDKLTATYEQLEENYHYHFAISSLYCLANLQMISKDMVKSQGEQREREERLFCERIKAGYDDAMKTLDKFPLLTDVSFC